MRTSVRDHALKTAGHLTRVLAMFAMVVQVLFFAEHIGAMAAKSSGNAALDARLGFLEICTGNGVEVVGLDGGVDPNTGCPICVNASVMAFGEPAALPTPEFSYVTFATAWTLPARSHATDNAFPGAKPIRAPPVV